MGYTGLYRGLDKRFSTFRFSVKGDGVRDWGSRFS